VCLLTQAYLLVSKSPEPERYVTPPSLTLAAWQAFRASQEALLAAASPPITQDVARVLGLLGLPVTGKVVSEDGLFALNLALPDR
jgi:hypothetical protein